MRKSTRRDAVQRFERWLEIIPACSREDGGVALERLARDLDDTPEAILDDVRALVEREYYLPGSFADSIKILIDGDSLEIDSPDQFQRPIRFSTLEALAIQLGLQLHLTEAEDGNPLEAESAVRRLVEALGTQEATGADDSADRERQSSGPAPFMTEPAMDHRAVAPVRDALRSGRIVEFSYYKPHKPDETTDRRVSPWALVSGRSAWYLLGRDEDAGEPRVFRLDRILDVQVSEASAVQPERLEVEEFIDPQRIYQGDDDDLEVAIEYQPEVARCVSERYGSGANRSGNGCVEVTHSCKTPDWAITHALGYGAAARVQAPDYVRDRARADLRMMVFNRERVS